jgi:hypothetical protein
MSYNHNFCILRPLEREPRKRRVKIRRHDCVKLTFSGTKVDEFVTDANIAMVDESDKGCKASHRYGVTILVSRRKGRNCADRTAEVRKATRAAKRMGTNSHANRFDIRRYLQWVSSLAGFLFAAVSLGLDILRSRQKGDVRPRVSMGSWLLDLDGPGSCSFPATAL